MEVHPSQLMICHQEIGERERDKQGRYTYCSLPAHAWCVDDGYYICAMHLDTRHEFHHIQTRQQEADEPAERRHGPDRRKEAP